MTSAATFWDKAAPKYAESTISDLEGYRDTLAITIRHLSATDRVLELGCGTASTALEVAPHVAEVTATDISTAMIDIGREKVWNAGIRNVELKTADVTDAALMQGAPYDVVLALNLLHLLPEQEAALAHIHRLLKPGGLLISKTACIGEKWFFRPIVAVLRAFGKAPFVTHQRREDLRDAMSIAGFEPVEELVQTGTPARLFSIVRKI